MRCPSCGYIRTRLDPLPDTHCPDCGAEYTDAERKIGLGLLRAVPQPRRERAPLGGRGVVLLLAPLVLVAAGWYLVLAPAGGPEMARSPGPILKGSIPAAAAAQPQVVMYATSWCPYCAKTRAFFKRHGIQYVEYDIERDAAAQSRYKSLGGNGVPLILVGEETIDGFHEPRLRSLLGPWLGKRS
jgi:glutaredoxin